MVVAASSRALVAPMPVTASRSMVAAAWGGAADADLVVLLVEALADALGDPDPSVMRAASDALVELEQVAVAVAPAAAAAGGVGQRGSDQVVHGGIDDSEVFFFIMFYILNTGQQNAGIAGYSTAWLDEYFKLTAM